MVKKPKLYHICNQKQAFQIQFTNKAKQEKK